MLRKFLVSAFAGLVLTSAGALAGTFGTVVPIGGEAADIALDPTRGVLYVANFTANRIDVMSLANLQIQTSINVAAQPSSISVSPDGHWLLAAHYGNNTAPASPTNALTLIDLTNNYASQTFALSNAPLGVAFGADGNALVVTTQAFLLLNPTLGAMQTLQTISQVATNSIPQPPASFPGNIVQASIAASADGLTIAGFGGSSPYLLFRYNVATQGITSSFYVSSPPAGPRTVSLSDNGSLASFAWWLSDANFVTTAEFPTPSGTLNIGSTLIDSSRNLVYAQVPSTTQVGNTPLLQIFSSDNLTLVEQIQLPENLAGKSVLSSDHNTMYSISDSGVLVLPVGNLGAYPRLSASAEDVVFRGNFCNRNVTTQTFVLTDPGGNRTPFSLSTNTPGLTISPSSGVTPATITISADPNAFASQKGTTAAAITISSSTSIDLPQTVRVLVNSQDPSQRGIFVDVPGHVVDLLADPKRNFYYVVRQDQNQVLIFNSTNNTQTATLRTCTKPTGMAITFDQQYLLVGCDSSHYMSVFDLDTLQAQTPVSFLADYVESVAASANAILATIRSGIDGHAGIDQINLVTHTGTALPTLGVWQNLLGTTNSVLASSSNGGQILMAGTDGSVMIYDANANTFTASRKDFTSLQGAYAASNYGQFVVGSTVLNSSGAPAMPLPIASGAFSSGFAFVNETGYFTSSANVATATSNPASSPGVITQINLSTGGSTQPTYMVEAPLLGNVTLGVGNYGSASTCTTTTSGTTTTEVCNSTTGGITTTTTTVCTGVGSGSSSCSTSTASAPATTTVSGLTRSLAPLPNQTAIISLSTSGFIVLPWNYAASVAPPTITSVTSAADGTSPVAPGGLISVNGSNLGPTNLASSEIPLPTALANSCLTVNGQPIPIIFVSPTQINAQLPFQAEGDVTLIVDTPGGVSPNFNLVIQPTAPAVFLSGVAGPETNLPTVVRAANNLLATDSNPVQRGDSLVIYLTGLGQTNPFGTAGQPSAMASVLAQPTVLLGGQNLPVSYAGLSPGEVGVYQINVTVPNSTPEGLDVPLTITQGGYTDTIGLRVIN
jgi:uncharacterized protein (TIGR03437 family)